MNESALARVLNDTRLNAAIAWLLIGLVAAFSLVSVSTRASADSFMRRASSRPD